MLVDLTVLSAGLICPIYGSELAVDAASSAAHRLDVSTPFCGATVVAVWSSIPEIATAIYGSLYGQGDFVGGAAGVASSVGAPWYLLGIVTGLGTTVPEIAVAFESVYRHERPIAVGTLLGSYITDLLFSLGIGAAVGGLAGSDPRPAVLGGAYMLVASIIAQSVAYWRGTLAPGGRRACRPLPAGVPVRIARRAPGDVSGCGVEGGGRCDAPPRARERARLRGSIETGGMLHAARAATTAIVSRVAGTAGTANGIRRPVTRRKAPPEPRRVDVEDRHEDGSACGDLQGDGGDHAAVLERREPRGGNGSDGSRVQPGVGGATGGSAAGCASGERREPRAGRRDRRAGLNGGAGRPALRPYPP
jgi:hypothetical protein